MPVIKKNQRQKPWIKAKPAFEQASKSDGFYHTTQWRKCRLMILRAEPCCRICDQNGIVKLAKMVDHIMPIENGGAHLDPANLHPLCNECHGAKSKQDAENNKNRIDGS